MIWRYKNEQVVLDAALFTPDGMAIQIANPRTGEERGVLRLRLSKEEQRKIHNSLDVRDIWAVERWLIDNTLFGEIGLYGRMSMSSVPDEEEGAE